jgi:hypothetical protein
MEKAREISPDSKRAKKYYQLAREAEIDKTIDYFADKAEIRNHERLIDVQRAWIEPTINTDKDPIYYSQKHFTDENPLQWKAQRVIPVIEFEDAELRQVLKYLSDESGINIVIDEKAIVPQEKVSIFLKDTSLLDALKIVLRAKGLVYRLEENMIWITTRERLKKEDAVVKVYDVQDLLGRIYDFPSAPLGETLSLKSSDEDDDKKKKKKSD